MKRFFLICISLLTVSFVSAQLTVSEDCVLKPTDLRAVDKNQNEPILNEYGDPIPFAIVQVGLADPRATFESGQKIKNVLKSEFKENHYLVYFADGTKNFTVNIKGYAPLDYTFPTPLRANSFYTMTILKPKDESQLGELEIKSNVAKAELYIDGTKVSDGAPFVYKGEGGAHTLEVKAAGFATQTRNVEIPVGQRASITVNLFTEGSLDVGGVSYGLVSVSDVKFSMGSNDHYYEQPVRTINLRPFNIGATLVSVDLWKNVMGEADDRIKGENGQVVNVTYDECIDFISMLNEKTGKSYRLPIEAEWEYCARNAAKLGISDMKSCMEWCSDWFGKYQPTADASPRGPETGVLRVVRGGSESDLLKSSTDSFRWYMHPEKTSKQVSFRLVCDD